MRLVMAAFFIALFSRTTVAEEAKIDAADIVKKADRVRAPSTSFESRMQLVDHAEKDSEPKQYDLKLYCKGTDKSVCRFEGPPRDRGKAVLMVDQDCWIYMPSTLKAVRVSAQQRLVGQVSNADAARLSFSGDYDAKYIGDAQANGLDCYKIELTAKTNKVAYSKLHYYVAKDGNLPQKVEYFALSGMLLKVGTYTKYGQLAGANRPTCLELVDAVRQGIKTDMIFSEMKESDPPDYYFNQSMLDRIR